MGVGGEAKGKKGSRRVLVVVAHPDDETLWGGGTILMHLDWQWSVETLCRASDPDRAPRFARAMARLRARGCMADLDDEPEQTPLDGALLRETILSLTQGMRFDLFLTHSPRGEYTRHLRHEETGEAVLSLWENAQLSAPELWMFAYEDGGRRYRPRPIPGAHRIVTLPRKIWLEKCSIIRDIYGFGAESFEMQAATREEAFWCFASPADAARWASAQGQ